MIHIGLNMTGCRIAGARQRTDTIVQECRTLDSILVLTARHGGGCGHGGWSKGRRFDKGKLFALIDK